MLQTPVSAFWIAFIVLTCAQLSASAEQKNITAESGQNVTLTCRAPFINISVTAVEWSRADLGSEYVLLVRDDQSDPEHQHPSFRNRVDLQDRRMKDGDVSLILKNVTVNDEGKYECHVIQRGANRRRRRAVYDTEPIKIISLRVVDPVDQPGGATEEEEEGAKQRGVSRGHPGLIVSLSLPAVLLVAAAVVLIYSKHKLQRSYQHPDGRQTV